MIQAQVHDVVIREVIWQAYKKKIQHISVLVLICFRNTYQRCDVFMIDSF